MVDSEDEWKRISATKKQQDNAKHNHRQLDIWIEKFGKKKKKLNKNEIINEYKKRRKELKGKKRRRRRRRRKKGNRKEQTGLRSALSKSSTLFLGIRTNEERSKKEGTGREEKR